MPQTFLHLSTKRNLLDNYLLLFNNIHVTPSSILDIFTFPTQRNLTGNITSQLLLNGFHKVGRCVASPSILLLLPDADFIQAVCLSMSGACLSCYV